MQDDVYEDRESDPRQIINMGELCQIMFQRCFRYKII